MDARPCLQEPYGLHKVYIYDARIMVKGPMLKQPYKNKSQFIPILHTDNETFVGGGGISKWLRGG